MDPQRFDALARILAGQSTRRRTLLGMAGAAAGLVVPVVEGEARKRRKRRREACKDVGEACGERRCCGAATCSDGRCVCPPGFGRCGGQCVGENQCAFGRQCDPPPAMDTCSGQMSCTGQIDGQPTCCGVDYLHECGRYGGGPACCSGVCEFRGHDGVLRCGPAASSS